MLNCPVCGSDAPDTAPVCVICATPLPGFGATTTPPPEPAATGLTNAQRVGDVETILPAPSAPTAGGGPTRLAPGQTFGQRYQVIRLLGAGGMGAVYHVWDSELNLPLALKVIRPDPNPQATQELERRFKRELVLARQVTHTNVIRIHDLGEFDGIKYITMPFVPGTDLARLLKTDGKLPPMRALAFARQIAAGLRAAHEVGVVHRDLKPANILIGEEDKAIITDFGIARSTESGTIATAAGAIVGTLAYMAPEQALGKPVDQRADIYAFGLIVSEMLVSRRAPSQGDTALALLIERSRQAPPRLRTIDPSIPDGLDRIVARCLEPDPEARYQTTRELEAELARLDAEGHDRAPVAVPPVPPATVVPAPNPSSKLPLVAVAAALVAALAGGSWYLMTPSPPPPSAAGNREPVSGTDRGLQQPGEGTRVRGIARTSDEHRHRRRVVHHQLSACGRADDRQSAEAGSASR